jgi:hypothetical protein
MVAVSDLIVIVIHLSVVAVHFLEIVSMVVGFGMVFVLGWDFSRTHVISSRRIVLLMSGI